jgi:hypothetical protein
MVTRASASIARAARPDAIREGNPVTRRTTPTWALLLIGALVLTGCSSGNGASDSGGTAGSGGSGGTAGSGGSGGSSGPTTDCTGTTHVEQVVCAANELLASLSTSEKTAVNLAYTDAASRTRWSNLPTGMVPRAGMKLSDLSNAASVTAALALMNVVLSDAGYSDLDGVRAADDYLAANGGGNGYGAGLYYVAIFGTPSTSDEWALMFGGHHMVFTVTYVGGVGYPIPNHLGAEPKDAFTLNNTTYQPLADEGSVFTTLFASLSSTDLATAYLSGQSFSDVVVGPVEYDTGSSAAAKAKFPSGANRKGVLVSSLSSAQQALVAAAIGAWVNDFEPALSDQLMADYTTAAAYADTYVAWGGTQASGPDPDVQGTYFRIDGPRVWIEVACQGGIVFRTKTHFHTIYRDKQYDYGGTL